MFQSVLHALDDGTRRGVVALGVLLDHLLHLIPNQLASQAGVLESSVHPGFGLALRLEFARCQIERTLDRDALQRLGCDDGIHQPHLLGLWCSHLLACQHHVHGVLQTHERMQILRAAEPGQQAQLDFRQTKLDLVGVRAHSVVAPKRPLQATAEGGSVDAAYQRHPLGFHALEECQAVFDDRDQVLLVLDGLEIEDVGPGNEHVGLGRKEDDGLDVFVGVDFCLPHHLRLIRHGEADGVHALTGAVDANHRHAIGGDLDVLEEFILPIRRGFEAGRRVCRARRLRTCIFFDSSSRSGGMHSRRVVM
mmetsp:Transcript_3959/g.10468  ORF Transcript_3959/g.10468 Transcript_3959/m.10468 type:complete len:307 (-) Transcript_3959:268-1188(-)